MNSRKGASCNHARRYNNYICCGANAIIKIEAVSSCAGQNLLAYLLSRYIVTRIYKTINLSVDLYRCENLSLALREFNRMTI
jgi:hypothetical protein